MGNRLYVGNLPYSTTDDSLREAFAAHGEVVSASVVIDRESGRSRGFGFVEMATGEAAQAATAAMNGALLDGRPLTVNEARERTPGGGGRRFGGGGGGGWGGGGGFHDRFHERGGGGHDRGGAFGGAGDRGGGGYGYGDRGGRGGGRRDRDRDRDRGDRDGGGGRGGRERDRW